MTRSCLALSLGILVSPVLTGAPVSLVNPSGEINNGIDRTAIPNAAFPGWQGSGGQSITGGTHGGNGAWRMSIGSLGDIRQLTGHQIAPGEAFSLRFDAATFSGLPPGVTAEFFTESTPGVANVIFSKFFAFNVPLVSGSWEGFQVLTNFGDFNSQAGNAIGVRFRNTSGSGSFLSVDNVRLEVFSSPAAVTDFSQNWATTPARPWLGADLWANRLQDWEISGGRLQTRDYPTSKPLRTAHLLTTAIREEPGDFSLGVHTGIVPSVTWNAGALTGIFMGAGASHDFRGAALMHHRGGRDGGLLLGVNASGQAVIFSNGVANFGAAPLAQGNTPAAPPASCRLEVSATWQSATRTYLLALVVRDGTGNAIVSQANFTAEPYAVLGNIGLFSHPASGSARFWFQDFTGSGRKLEARPDRAFGPVVSTQYTLSRKVLKLTAQLAPVVVAGAPGASLEIDTGSGWQSIASATIDPAAYTAWFRIPQWTHTAPVPFRVGFPEDGVTRYRGGIIQADPVDKPEIVAAALTCFIHCAADSANDGFNGIDETNAGPVSWTRDRINFPHEDIVRNLPLQQPDLYAFTGDQLYEGGSPTVQDSTTDENRRLDYLYKWYLWCWTFRDLTADRPSITIPDDHDIYQGNLWGEGGKATTTQENGGYTKPAAFVKMVERTQTSHLPDPHDSTPVLQGIGVYYSSWVYGRVGFAILEDRKFKNGYADEGFGPVNGGDPASDTTRFNKAGLELLGPRQEAFLDAFAADWAGQDMKAVISQSPFASSSTHTGPFQDGFGNSIHVFAAANPAHYFNKKTNQGTELLHGRGPGYGIVRFNKPARTTTFECWPLYAGPDSGAQYPGWPLTIRQTENDGRTPVAFLPVIDTGTASDPVVRVYNESDGSLVYGYRVLGNRYRPPVHLTGITYRVETTPADGGPTGITTGVSASSMPAHSIILFEGSSRYAIRGQAFRLRWDSPSASSLSIDQGIGNVAAKTLHGIGIIDIVPAVDTTWTLTSAPASGPALQAQVSVRVFSTMEEWRAASFSPADLADPAKETTLWGDAADPDQDGLFNAAEYAAQTPPLAGVAADVLRSDIAGVVVSSATGNYPVHVLRELLPGAGYTYEAQWSENLGTWNAVPWDTLVEVNRAPGAAGQTDMVTLRMPESIAQSAPANPRRFYRVVLKPAAPAP